jgi:ketosteroid isomerase-like protein
MASKQSKESVDLFKRMSGGIAADPQMSMADMRAVMEHGGDATTEPRGVQYIEAGTQRTPGSERPTRKDAKTLLLEFLAAVTRGQNAAALFAEDGAVELPFLHSLGIPWRHRGRQAISELQDSLARLYLDFAFKPEDTHVLIDTPEQVFAEYMAHPTARATGRTVHHLFTGRLVAKNGQIKLLRESLNPVAVAQALLPGGVKDLPDPEKVIFSVPPDCRS